ncbi:MAG: ABC transporter substrate-binding protein [Candidatus ainarchaeum sp.]|nr:ABC transporter substrate-binding protein [Candidatus ainarchaeum sp.]
MGKNILLVVGVGFIFVAAIIIFAFIFSEPGTAIKIGAIIPLTGDVSYMGQSMKNGIDLASKETGLKVVYEDSQGKKDVAVNAYNKLTQLDGVNYILGSQSGVILSYSSLAKEQKKIVFAIGTASPGLTKNNDYLFRNNLYTAEEAEFNARQIYNLGYKNLVLLAHNQPGGVDYLKIISDNYGGKIEFQEIFYSALDFKTILSKIKDSNADSVFVYSYASELAELLKESYGLGLNVRWFSFFAMEEKTIHNLPLNVKEGLVYSYPIDDKNPKYLEFQEKYFSVYGEYPDLFAALAYDNIFMLKQAMQGCEYENTDCVKDNLLEIKEFEGVSGLTSIDSDGDSHKPIYLKTIKDGEFVMFENQ